MLARVAALALVAGQASALTLNPLRLFKRGEQVAGLNNLLARRSVVKYADKAVGSDVTTKALEAAILAPNHFLSEPWRFYTAGPETKAKLCGLNEDKRKAAEGVARRVVGLADARRGLRLVECGALVRSAR